MRGTALAPVMNRMREEVDRLFDRMIPGSLFNEPMFPPFEGTAATWVPNLDLTEKDNEFIVRLEVPGMHKENLDVNLTGNLLTITGHREETREGKEERFIWQEREAGRFSRTLRLPAPVLDKKIDATHHNGVLSVRLPKADPSAGAKILIK